MTDVAHEVFELWIEVVGEPPAIHSDPHSLLDALIASLPEPPLDGPLASHFSGAASKPLCASAD